MSLQTGKSVGHCSITPLSVWLFKQQFINICFCSTYICCEATPRVNAELKKFCKDTSSCRSCPLTLNRANCVQSQFAFSSWRGCTDVFSTMAREAYFGLAVLLLVFHPTSAFNSSEAQKAKGLVDSLSKNLHNNLKSYKETIEKTEEKIHETVKELLIVKKVQVLLGQLNNQQVPGEMCEHRYIVPDFHYKRNILIETHSALPPHYTITVQGKFVFHISVLLLTFHHWRLWESPGPWQSWPIQFYTKKQAKISAFMYCRDSCFPYICAFYVLNPVQVLQKIPWILMNDKWFFFRL